MLNTRKILIALEILLLVISIFAGVYVFRYRGSTNISNPSNPNVNKEPAPSDEVQEITPKPKEYINYLEESKVFELPIEGASGYAAIDMELKDGLDSNSNVIAQIKAGSGFTILKEEDEYFKINYNEKIGYVNSIDCFINLPDILPSIVYNITNAKGSIMISSGKDIPNVTGEVLYDAYQDNPRYGTKEYIVPVLYSMAKKIALAQQYAIEENNTLIIYEAYRPYEVQRKIVKNLSELALQNPVISEGINTAPWSMVWFISTGLSNHQRGCAIDVSLGKIVEIEEKHLGDYVYKDIIEYEEYTMFSKMHELSVASVIYPYQVDSNSKEAWKNVKLLDNVNPEVKTLQGYCTKADLTPLASEWWHFNDLDSVKTSKSKGNFAIDKNYSIPLKESEQKID